MSNMMSPSLRGSKQYKRRNYLPSPRMDVAVDQIPSHHLRSSSIESEAGDQAHLDQVNVQLLKSTETGMEPMVRTASSSRSNSSFSMKSPISPRDIEARTARGVSEDIYGHDNAMITTKDANTGGNDDDDMYGNGRNDDDRNDVVNLRVIAGGVDRRDGGGGGDDDDEEDVNGDDDASSCSEYNHSS